MGRKGKHNETRRGARNQEERGKERRKKEKSRRKGREKSMKESMFPEASTFIVTQYHGNQPIPHNNDTDPLMRVEPS